MSRKLDFRNLLQIAQNKAVNDPIFDGIKDALKAGDARNAGMTVTLTAPKSFNVFRMMENAVRAAFNDERKARHPDALFNGSVDVEVKYRPDGFREVPSDTYAVKNIKTKWYILLSGDIQVETPHQYDAYLVRSDHFREAIDVFKKSAGNSDPSDLPPINPDSPMALKDIELAINDIQKDLAQAILRKSAKNEVETEKGKPRMSLRQRVGVNRVRFDIKFESLVRQYIREIIRG